MQKEYPQIEKIIGVIQKLRDPQDGCPWDLKQTHESLLKYLIEESFEYIHAVEEKDPLKMKEELGDVFLQVLLNAQIAEDQGLFNLEDVAQTLSEKMIRRHPHVFQDKSLATTSEEVLKNWDEIKKKEKNDRPFFNEEDLCLPALMSAQKIGKKSGKVNFDWDNIQEVFAKVLEEVEEVKVELQDTKNNRDKIFEEIGDLLFSVTQLARHMDFEAEECLRFANKKFISRFQILETLIKKDQKNIQALKVPELEKYWQAAKKLIKEK